MPLHDIGYKHWDGAHLGVWHRRLAIASYGLRACTSRWWMRLLIALAWFGALLMVAILFFAGQLLVEDSFMGRFAAGLNTEFQTMIKLLIRWLEQHPEISVPTTQNLLFYYFCKWMLWGSSFALGLVLPFLITRDTESNAMVIYSTKAITRGDYLLGKFATTFGFLTLTWLGPVLAAWLLGNLLAPQWSFFWHSRAVLGNVLLLGVCTMTILSLLAMGVSAIARNELTTGAIWFAWWALGGILTLIVKLGKLPPALQHFNLNYNLQQVALSIFRLDKSFAVAEENVPVLGGLLGLSPATKAAYAFPALQGALLVFALLLALSAFLLHRRTKPQ
jgi:hypothetical protein